MLRLADLGCKALYHGSLRQRGSASTFWSLTLPQLGQSDALVGASVTALGAALEFLQTAPARPFLSYARHYGFALQQVQDSINTQSSSSEALVTAALLLAVAEMLVEHDLPALSHLQGTLALVQQRQLISSNPSKDRLALNGSSRKSDGKFTICDDIDAAGAVLDVGTAAYALGLEPRLPKLSIHRIQTIHGDKSGLQSAELHVLAAMHAGYLFASRNYRWKYVPQRLKPRDVFVEQSRVTSELFQCIQQLWLLRPTLSYAHLIRALTLTAQCSACLVYVSALLDAYETTYDRYGAGFRAIVDGAETVISHSNTEKHNGLIDISLDLGVAQPLYFTAIKHRDFHNRQRALGLLEQAGRDGPCDGKKYAILARRAMDIEESIFVTVEGNESTLHATRVPETYRLHTAGIEKVLMSHGNSWTLSAVFSRCCDVDLMMAAESAEAHKDMRFWDMWEESLPFSREAGA